MPSFTPPFLYGVIGWPVAHSLSPLLHTRAFERVGWPGVLVPWAVTPDELPAFVAAARLLDVRGFCVTIPHKQAILPLVDEVSERAGAVGAANLVHRDGDRLCADNTDVPGFLAPLAAAGVSPASRTLLLGAGGAARAAAAGLAESGFADVTVTSPSGKSATRLAGDFGFRSVDWDARGDVLPDLLVNSTPLGMTGVHADETPFASEWLARKPGTAYDLVYTPLRTRLLREAEASGWRQIDGLGMFMGQADVQFRRWTGQALPAGAREWVLAALEEREKR